MRLARIVCLIAVCAAGQQGSAQAPAGAGQAVQRKDAVLEVASDEIGKALFLRCFCAGDSLSFDASGKPSGNVKALDWTLAGVNVQKVERKSANEIELDGVRVAIRFAADRREFDRKPLNDDKVKILVPDNGDPRAFEKTLKAVFAEGLDHALQAGMPDFWQHYFNPELPWPGDDLASQTIYIPGAPGPGKTVVPPSATKKAPAGFTAQAMHDHVQGATELRVVIDGEGKARRIAIVQPLGYGLDARAAESLAKWKFAPATLNGKAVPSYQLIRPEFTVVDLPQ